MGCICSTGDIQDVNPNIFYVTNVDNEGNTVKNGRLEITATELIFHEDDAPSIHWPLRCLRRYGWDSQMFSFESGRRAPTGVGIYAFMSPRAQEIFNLLQARFAAEESLASIQNSTSNCAFFVPRRHTSTVDGYLEPIAPRLVPRFRVTSTSPNGGTRVRLDSVDSCSETQSPSPSTSTPPTVIENTRSEGAAAAGFKQVWDVAEQRSDVERNNNGHEYSNGVVGSSGLGLRLLDSFPLALDVNRLGLVETDNSHVYMNVATGTEPKFLVLSQAVPAPCFTPTLSNLVIREESANEPQHCYANLELPEGEVPKHANLELPEGEVPKHANLELPGGEVPKPNGGVNYAVLDLDQAGNAVSPAKNLTPTEAPPTVPLVDSPQGQGPPPPSGYVTIDFDKTRALSNSASDRERKKKDEAELDSKPISAGLNSLP